MGHDHHFLSRLDRVKRDTVDFALSLYRDAELVKWVLETSMLPESAPRIGIALHDTPSPPHIVVTRDGHFVTCLGEGMHTGQLPIISRKELDAVLRDVESWRAREHRAKEVLRPGGGAGDLFRFAYKRAADLSREEFLALECWMPIVGLDFYSSMLSVAESLCETTAIAIATNAKARPPDELLRSTWNAMWSVGHLMALSVTRDTNLFEPLVRFFYDKPQSITSPACEQGIVGVIARGAWVAGRLGAFASAKYERELAQPTSDVAVLDAVVGLEAIRATDPSRRDEISKLLATSDALQSEPALSSASASLAALASSLSDAEAEAIVLDDGRTVCKAMTSKLPRDHALAFERREDIPEDVAIAAAATCPVHYRSAEPRSMLMTLALARVVARRKPAEMYLPEAFRACGSLYSPDQMMDLVREQRRITIGERTPRTASPRVGRNDPCPCGSNKKYKRCCGG